MNSIYSPIQSVVIAQKLESTANFMKYTLFYKQHFHKQLYAEIGKQSSKCYAVT